MQFQTLAVIGIDVAGILGQTVVIVRPIKVRKMRANPVALAVAAYLGHSIIKCRYLAP